jgi:hypothetical protein
VWKGVLGPVHRAAGAVGRAEDARAARAVQLMRGAGSAMGGLSCKTFSSLFSLSILCVSFFLLSYNSEPVSKGSTGSLLLEGLRVVHGIRSDTLFNLNPHHRPSVILQNF